MPGTSRRLATIDQAVASLRAGRPVLVVDAADRENEGDVVLAAESASAEWVAWSIRHTSGILCAPMSSARADRLELPPMVARNEDPRATAYTVSVDARYGITTGVSAADRATTLRLLADRASAGADLTRPGHVFPLRARPGGVRERPGHTEAAVDLCRLAGLPPVGVIAEVVEDDGRLMLLPGLLDLGQRFSLPVVTIADLAKRLGDRPWVAPVAQRVSRVSEADVRTSYGTLRIIGYRDLLTGDEHVALVAGPLRPDPLARVHSECLTGEALGSLHCECGAQLRTALAQVSAEGGVVVYLRGHEGRGIGLVKKIAAYDLQNRGRDTVQANLELGEAADGREFGAAAAILRDLGCTSVRLLTNNPRKAADLEAGRVTVRAQVPLVVGLGQHNRGYMRTKRDRMGHDLPALDDEPRTQLQRFPPDGAAFGS
ncbi:MAG: 3,4-dihydroxy 2-butanone 4-phosphate synthase / cyclohydrolase [Frankiales bacterium]|nr:3,4-dihydroxy 2-butanone 4-phosphate synthase / cyclohydrolase [Frankiales bacterium]